MRMRPIVLGTTLLATGLIACPAIAQTAPSGGASADDLAALRAQLEALSARVQTLEGELAVARAAASVDAETPAPALAPAPIEAEPQAIAANDKPATTITFKGAPLFESEGGWSFKPRGRLQFVAGVVAAPDSTGARDGYGGEVRRARLGFEGTVPGGFGYKFEADFNGNEVEVIDAFISYSDDALTFIVGEHNHFQSLEELTSGRFTSFIERAAFTDAFNFERRLGVSGQYQAGDVLVQAGVFNDNIADLPDTNHSYDGRVVWMPRYGDTQLHLGGSVHHTVLQDRSDVRYRQRPFVHFTSTRFIDTGTLDALSELGYGGEAALISGRFHMAGEGYWQRVDRPAGLADPRFFGGYAEAGLFLTPGDTRGYRNGVFERVRPVRELGEGGFGAVQLVARYDYLDLNDAGIVGGIQNGYLLSLIWTPTDYTRLLLNYARLDYDDAVFRRAGGSADYSVDSLAVSAQIDF